MVELAGKRRIAKGREAEIFEWGDGTVLRLQRDPASGPSLERGAAAMAGAGAAGVPVPAVHDRVTVDGRPGLVMERVDGNDLFDDLARRPWRVLATGRLLAELHAALHETPAPSELSDLRADARDRIAGASELAPPLARAALAMLEQLPDGDRICHGDYHPGNVLVGARGPVIIDWTNATRGDPAADLARTRLMLRLAEVPPRSPAVLRVLEPVGRRMFARRYLTSYRRIRPVDRSLVDRWEIVRAADRFSEGIDSEFPALTAFLERAVTLST